jgi:hypothetical protein
VATDFDNLAGDNDTVMSAVAINPWRLSVAPMMDRCDYAAFMRVGGVPCAVRVQRFKRVHTGHFWCGIEVRKSDRIAHEGQQMERHFVVTLSMRAR